MLPAIACVERNPTFLTLNNKYNKLYNVLKATGMKATPKGQDIILEFKTKPKELAIPMGDAIKNARNIPAFTNEVYQNMHNISTIIESFDISNPQAFISKFNELKENLESYRDLTCKILKQPLDKQFMIGNAPAGVYLFQFISRVESLLKELIKDKNIKSNEELFENFKAILSLVSGRISEMNDAQKQK